MDIFRKLFYIFSIISIIFFIAGIYSGYTLANIEKSRNLIISSNPVDVSFKCIYNETSYVLKLEFKIKNPGVYDYWIDKITWTSYLVNNSNGKLYQANEYQRYYPEKIRVESGKSLEIVIIDNKTTHQWESRVLKELKWLIKEYGKDNITWENTLSVNGWLDSFAHDEYKYNQRTWYLWKLPEVLIEYESKTKGF